MYVSKRGLIKLPLKTAEKVLSSRKIKLSNDLDIDKVNNIITLFRRRDALFESIKNRKIRVEKARANPLPVFVPFLEKNNLEGILF
jgi:hypothetical protein